MNNKIKVVPGMIFQNGGRFYIVSANDKHMTFAYSCDKDGNKSKENPFDMPWATSTALRLIKNNPDNQAVYENYLKTKKPKVRVTVLQKKLMEEASTFIYGEGERTHAQAEELTNKMINAKVQEDFIKRWTFISTRFLENRQKRKTNP